MFQLPSRTGLVSLAEEAGRVAPVLLGFVRSQGDRRASLLCTGRHGLMHCTVPSAEIPHVLLPSGEELRQIGTPDLDDSAGQAIGWLLERAGARRVVSMAIADGARASRFWLASPNPDALAPEQMSVVRATAASATRLLALPAPHDASADYVSRLVQVGDFLPALLRVLDVRELFDRVSEISRQCLPHDHLLLHVFSDDLTQVATFNGIGELGPPRPCVHPPALTRVCDFDIIDDVQQHPLQIDEPFATLKARSSLRLFMRFDDRVIGDVTFISCEPGRFNNADVAIGRRLADHAAMALSHHNLAEASRRTAALQERATNLEVLDGLLATLTGVLDVREVFDRVSTIAQKVLPHDAMSMSEIIDNGEKVRIHASHGLGQLQEPFDMVVPDPTMVRELWDYRLLDDVRDHPEYAKGPGWAAGMRCMLFVSIRMEDRNWGGLNFYSRTPGHFVRDDVLVARRITDHVALAVSHRRLAEEARKSEELRARATSLELLDELLAALADTGDVHAVLATISGSSRRVLAHDGAALIMRLPDSMQARVYATCGFPAKIPEDTPIPDHLVARADWEHDIVNDLSQDPAPLYDRVSRLGFRSLIRVPIRMDGRFTGALALLAKGGGAFKPTDVLVVRRMADRLTVTLARDREIAASQRADEATARAARLEARVKTLTEELDARTGYRRVIGESLPWRQVLRQAAQVAATETTVLLLGESGTGKEVVARFLHRGSARKTGPFVALNCAALPEQLLEAELFGYERGAYTGATQSKPGQLEQAAGGTLFLDEVAEMSMTAQPKFLRVLQEREFQRLGGTRVLRTDARIVAATNRDLLRSIERGHFREDLYYRLNVFAIRLPPLRERRDDILPLSEAFIAEIGRGLGRPPAGISRDAKQMLLDYQWPGNVRELRNVLERAAILCDGGLITADLLSVNVTPSVPSQPPVTTASTRAAVAHDFSVASPTADAAAPGVAAPEAAAPGPEDSDLSSVERAVIERALQNAKFNKSKAAKALGLSRHQLYIRMRRHGLE
jgi:transcriptional regulator with GAF, ATPase, and Fis domain